MTTRRRLTTALRVTLAISATTLAASCAGFFLTNRHPIPLLLILTLAISGALTSATAITLTRIENRDRYRHERDWSKR